MASRVIPPYAIPAHLDDLLAAYGRARRSNTPLDSLFVAFDDVIPAEDLADVRAFALGELDGVYGDQAGYRESLRCLVAFEADSQRGTLWDPSTRGVRWASLGIVALAEEIGSDPFLTDLFLWAGHHNADADAADLITRAVTAIVGNASGARTKTGRSIKVDQALAVLRRLEQKAHQSGPQHQEMWCRAVANVLERNR